MKSVLAGLAVLVASVPLMANPPASMKPQPKAPVHVPTTSRPTTTMTRSHYHVYVRADAHDRWHNIGWTTSLSDAQYYARHYRSLGYDTFVR